MKPPRFIVAVLLAALATALQAQTPDFVPPSSPLPVSDPNSPAAPAQTAPLAKPPRQPKASERRRAAKLYLQSTKLFKAERFEDAMHGYEKAAKLDPTNADYPLAIIVARNHAVTALIQAAAKSRNLGNAAAARSALAHALALDPHSEQVAQHLGELGSDQIRGLSQPLYDQGAATVGAAPGLEPSAGARNFHLHASDRSLIQQVFKAYGIDITLDASVRTNPDRFDIDNASFQQAVETLDLVTNSFYVPLDAHRVLVARDTQQNREQFIRQDTETIYLSGLSEIEITEVSTLAKNIFELQTTGLDASAGTITLRAPSQTLTAFDATLRNLLDGHSQVLLNVQIFQLAHTSEHNTGVQAPQSMSAYNVYTEEQSILTSNSTEVQEIISSGLASANDPLAIIGILVAAGDVSSGLFSNGIALFGGGITESALSPGSATVNFSLNSSNSRALDQLQLRLGDGEKGIVRLGERYPIQTSSYSSLTSSASSIAGVTTAGSSSTLTSLLASLTGSSSSATIPMVEYEDLGLNLTATPNILRNGDVALTLDEKITALTGSSINGNPVLSNSAYEGVVTIRDGSAVVVASELSTSESKALSGTPGISEIPGLGDLTGNDTDKNTSTLLIVITPHVVRGSAVFGHSPMLRVERGRQQAR